MSIAVLLSQVFIIFLEIGVGVLVAKLGIVTGESSRVLANLVMTITLPCTLLASANIDAAPGTVGLMLLGFGLLLVLYIVCTALCLGLAKRMRLSAGQRAVFIAVAVLPNSAFIGIPLVTSLLGQASGAVYAAAGMLAYNLFFFTYVTHLFEPEKKFSFKTLMTPTNVATALMALMLLTGLRLPETLDAFVSAVGNCTTPLALMIAGVMLAGSDLRAMVKNRFLYLVTILRCVVFPLAFMGLLYCLPVNRTMAMGVTILAACPSASLGAVLAKQLNVEPELASQAVAHSTLFILISVPALLLLAGQLFLAG